MEEGKGQSASFHAGNKHQNLFLEELIRRAGMDITTDILLKTPGDSSQLRQMCMFLTFAEIWVNNLVESKNKTSFPKAVNFPDASSIMNKILQRRSYSRARSRPSG